MDAATATNDHGYTQANRELIQSIADEAAALFPAGKVFPNSKILKDEVSAFAHKKGFVVGTISGRVACSRAAEPQSEKNKRERRTPLPAKKQRKEPQPGVVVHSQFSSVVPTPRTRTTDP